MSYEFKTTPYQHQLKVWTESKHKVGWAYFMEMGTGKTWIMINVMGWLYEQNLIDAAVYIAKKGEYANFQTYEIPDHLPDRIKRECLLFSSFHLKLPAYLKKFQSLLRQDRRRLPIFSVNIEALIHGGDDALGEFYKAHKRVLLLLDESSSVKHYDTKRSKQVYYWALRSAYKRIATGTPVTQAPMDLYGQSLVLGKNTLGFSSYYAFRNTYCNMKTQHLGNRTFQAVNGYKNLEELSTRVRSFSHQYLKKDCLDLPEKIYKKIAIPLTFKQQELYNRMRDTAMLEIEGHEIEVVNVLAQITKLHQIVCGQLKVSENKYVSIENDRLTALLDILEDYEGSVIIWANYVQVIYDVSKVLKEKFGADSVAEFHGGVNEVDRKKAIDDFRTGKKKIWVGNPGMGYGLTLTIAKLVIYYSNSTNLEHRLQSEDRAHRIGQDRDVTYIDFIAPGTVEERIVEILRSKKEMAEIVMGQPISYWLG